MEDVITHFIVNSKGTVHELICKTMDYIVDSTECHNCPFYIARGLNFTLTKNGVRAYMKCSGYKPIEREIEHIVDKKVRRY